MVKKGTGLGTTGGLDFKSIGSLTREGCCKTLEPIYKKKRRIRGGIETSKRGLP